MAINIEIKSGALLGIVGLVCALLGFGGSEVLDADTIDRAYVCSTNGKLGFFDRLSSTSKTGYYINELGEEKRNVCYKGYWIDLITYSKDMGVDPEMFIKESVDPTLNLTDCPICEIEVTTSKKKCDDLICDICPGPGYQELCSSDGCVEI